MGKLLGDNMGFSKTQKVLRLYAKRDLNKHKSVDLYFLE